MKKAIKIAVIGGTGKSGKYLVRELIAQGYQIKTLVRNPKNFTEESPLVEVVHGNVEDPDALRKLISGCQAVISTLGIGIPQSKHTIFTQATKNLLPLARGLKVERYIVISGLHVDTPGDQKSKDTQMKTDWMYAHYPVSTQDKQKEFELLDRSTMDWTLVRLPLIELTEAQGEISTSLTDCPGEKIGARDLALFLIGQLNDSTFHRKAPFLANV
ncbi:MAG: NAD(P)H-binding protein [Bacteroidota bacterium]